MHDGHAACRLPGGLGRRTRRAAAGPPARAQVGQQRQCRRPVRAPLLRRPPSPPASPLLVAAPHSPPGSLTGPAGYLLLGRVPARPSSRLRRGRTRACGGDRGRAALRTLSWFFSACLLFLPLSPPLAPSAPPSPWQPQRAARRGHRWCHAEGAEGSREAPTGDRPSGIASHFVGGRATTTPLQPPWAGHPRRRADRARGPRPRWGSCSQSHLLSFTAARAPAVATGSVWTSSSATARSSSVRRTFSASPTTRPCSVRRACCTPCTVGSCARTHVAEGRSRAATHGACPRRSPVPSCWLPARLRSSRAWRTLPTHPHTHPHPPHSHTHPPKKNTAPRMPGGGWCLVVLRALSFLRRTPSLGCLAPLLALCASSLRTPHASGPPLRARSYLDAPAVREGVPGDARRARGRRAAL